MRVPDARDEAARDLVRAREDTRADLMRARHRLSKLLLRQGRVFDGRSKRARNQVILAALCMIAVSQRLKNHLQ